MASSAVGAAAALLVAPSAMAFAAVAVSPDDVVHVVVQQGNDVCRIKRYTIDGALLNEWGSCGDGAGQIAGGLGNAGIAVGPAGDVYVTDPPNHRVHRFSPDGVLLGTWGGLGNGDGQFQLRRDSSSNQIAVDVSGFVYVTDFDNARIQKFTADGTFVHALTKADTVGSRAASLATAPDGTLYAFEWGHTVTQIPSVEFEAADPALTSWGVKGQLPGQQQLATGGVVDTAGNIWVLDWNLGRIQQFTPTGTYVSGFSATVSVGGITGFPTSISRSSTNELFVIGGSNPLVRYSSAGTKLASWDVTSQPPSSLPEQSAVPNSNVPGADACDEPPAGNVGVTIERSSLYTTNADVELSAIWPRCATAMLVANDGAFTGATPMPVTTVQRWKLASSGDERLPKTVYVRFILRDGSSTANYTDDIILDETAPTVSQGLELAIKLPRATTARALARPVERRIAVVAADKNSGVDAVQVSSTRSDAAAWVPYRPQVSVKTTTLRLFTRVRDKAGNMTAWRAIPARTALSKPLISRSGRVIRIRTCMYSAMGPVARQPLQLKLKSKRLARVRTDNRGCATMRVPATTPLAKSAVTYAGSKDLQPVTRKTA